MSEEMLVFDTSQGVSQRQAKKEIKLQIPVVNGIQHV